MIPALYDALSTLSAMTGLFNLPNGVVYFFTSVVPLGQFSMGWISFAVVGFILGVIVQRVQKN